jgi:hypothetical protein
MGAITKKVCGIEKKLQCAKRIPTINFVINRTQIELYRPLDSITNPKYKLLHFLTTNFFAKRGLHYILTGIKAAI